MSLPDGAMKSSRHVLRLAGDGVERHQLQPVCPSAYCIATEPLPVSAASIAKRPMSKPRAGRRR